MSLDWGYGETNGPATWAQKFPQAAGSRQSPVDIPTRSVTSDSTLQARPLSWNYPTNSALSVCNTGYGWTVAMKGDGSELSGGPLTSKHVLEQFHCHWGCGSDAGSEHTVDGTSFAGELHLVHWNSGKYKSFAEAAGQPDGLAVLGVFLKVGKAHGELQKIVSLMPQIPHRGQKVPVKQSVDPARLLPDKRSYWTYLGSLTTPPCSESVTWIVFKEAVEVSEQQLAAFRTLRCYPQGEACPCDELKGLVINNYRPPLPLGNRELRECGSV